MSPDRLHTSLAVAALVATIGAAPLHCEPALAAITSSTACTTMTRHDPTPESKCYSIEHGGLKRTFRLYIPAKTTEGALPLIFVLHGGGGTGANMEWLTRQGFNRIADREGAIIAYPDGVGRSWNDGRADLQSRSSNEKVDDLGYLRELPREISGTFPVDVARVYATGISNGGFMAYRLACDAADVFAAVAPVAASLPVDLGQRCAPARAVSLTIINGTEDPIVPWNGGAIRVLWVARGSVLSAQATAARWMELDKCDSLHDVGGLKDAVADDGTALLQRTAECAGKSEITLYEVRGGGHTWPGGEAYLGQTIVGRVSHELNANETVWRFFSGRSLQ
ncbi:MAG: hypothetical protein JWM63_1326 [Gammaproteobacteria bacterium]|jgi:polyhydroxybutyrate depolymerase|nr:hypothetical protein [Gammaproteobacteria bacterium]